MISRRSVLALASAAAAVSLPSISFAEAVDFNTFTSTTGVQANTFPTPVWELPTTYNDISVDAGRVATESTNANTTFLLGPSSLTTLNKVITGDIYFGSDDDYVGIGIGMPQNPFTDTTNDYLLLQWKGASQSFNFSDVTGASSPFHGSTVGGTAPVGLSLSRVSGVPTADEFWQRQNLVMYDPQGKANPDPATDPQLGYDTGGLTELARGAVSGDRSYDSFGRAHRFEIFYTPTNIRVMVNGFEELNINAPDGTFFPEGTFGLYEQGQSPSGAYSHFDVRNIGDAAPLPGPNLRPPAVVPFAAAEVTIPDSTTNAASVWSVTRSTAAPGDVTIVSTPNVADVDIAIGGTRPVGPSGVLMATVTQNGSRNNGTGSFYSGVEAPAPSGFNTSTGLATFGYGSGAPGEFNTNTAVAFFPFENFRGGYVAEQGYIRTADVEGPSSPYTVTEVAVPLPTQVQYATNLDGTLPTALWTAGNQQVIRNLQIAGEHAQSGSGILFTIGASNEENTTAAVPMADGSWNISVRDNDWAYYGGPDTFERDDFAFLYLKSGELAGSSAARVTGMNSAVPQVAQSWGDYTLDHVTTGVYELNIPGGESYTIQAQRLALDGSFSYTDTDSDGDGTVDTRTFANGQTLTPTLADGAFSFAFVPFNPGDTSAGMLLLTSNETITLSDGTIAPANHWLTYQLGGIPTWKTNGSGNWSEGTHWRNGVPNAAGASANLSHANTAPATITLDSSATLQNLYFNSPQKYTIASNGAGTTGLNVSGFIGVHGGSHEITAPLNLTAPTRVAVSDGSALKISGPLSGKMSGINIAPTGELNVGTNDVIVDYDGVSPEQQLRQYVINGRATGNGLTTQENPDDDTVLAIVDNTDWGRTSFNGTDIDTSTVIGKYTYFGDANLDGKVTGDDYVAIDSNLGTGDSWIEGDFNMDGRVSGDDYVAIDSNLGNGTLDPLAFAELKAEMVAAHVERFGEGYLTMLADAEANGFQVVPEPGSLALLAMATAGLLARRRRNA